MDDRFRSIAALAATQHSVISTAQLAGHGVDSSTRAKWQRRGLIDRLGPRSFALAGSAPSFERSLAAGLADLRGLGVVAGRAAARLHGLDGFTSDAVELLVPRAHRGYESSGLVCSTRLPLHKRDVTRVQGFRCVTAERLIIDAPLFDFSRTEIENAIDSSLRRRLVAEQRLRTRVISEHRRAINGGRQLLDALVDSGGESRLERWFLGSSAKLELPDQCCRRPRWHMNHARVDAYFPGGLVVEVAGHGTHASGRQRQIDEQRRTELTLRGLRVVTFTYEDARDRPAWVIARLREALALAA